MALGLFIALLPLMGLQMPIAVAIAELLRRLFSVRLSRLAAAVGVWITNPLTAAPIYAVCYLVGLPFVRWFLPSGGHSMPPAVETLATLAEGEVATAAAAGRPLAVEVLLALGIGGVILGVPLAFVGYRLTHGLVSRYQLRRARRSRTPAPVADAANPS
jgi:uncharacterized protein